MPFAFCQFTVSLPRVFLQEFLLIEVQDPAHAERAIREGRGRMIHGRACRTEKAQANRQSPCQATKVERYSSIIAGLFFIERKYGHAITEPEVLDLLQEFGKIEHCYTPQLPERIALNLNEGVIVQFEMFECGRNAQSVNTSNILQLSEADDSRLCATMNYTRCSLSTISIHQLRAAILRTPMPLELILLGTK